MACGALGYYTFDASTPIVAGTWEAALAAARCAMTAAALVAEGDSAAYALCRPPGHHAGRGFFGGYCYLNNAALAAQHLRDHGCPRVAILDVDYHHGNGTQEIFWERDDVLFVSLHATPESEFPYFLGYADERGVGRGEGHTLNLPLPLGVDTFEADPISGFKLTGLDYAQLGDCLAAARLPTVLVQEGGYAIAEIGANVTRVLGAFP